MNTEILINSTPQEVRVAILENKVLAEVFIERKKERGILGNIYKGRVLKVLPGMQAAFVDIGLPKAGFLYVADDNGDAVWSAFAAPTGKGRTNLNGDVRE